LAYAKLTGKAKLKADLAQLEVKVIQAQDKLNATLNGVPLQPGTPAYIAADQVFKDAVTARNTARDALDNYKEPEKSVKPKTAKETEAERQAAIKEGKTPVIDPNTGETVITVEDANKKLDAAIKDSRQFVFDLKEPGQRSTLAQQLKDANLYEGPITDTFTPDLAIAYNAFLTSAKTFNSTNKKIKGFTPVDADSFLTYRTNIAKLTPTATGNVPTTNISDPTEAAGYIRSVFKTVLQRDPTDAEITNYKNVLNKAEKKNPRKTVNGVTTGGLGNPIEFLVQEIQKLPEFSTKKKDKDTLISKDIQSVAKANGINLSTDQLASYANDVRNGKDINIIKNTIRDSAGLGMPDNIKKMLANGTDLETIYSPYKTTMASTLELNPNDIQIDDPILRKALGPDKELSIYDFQKIVKKDPRWQYTNNAQDQVGNVIDKVLKDFGFKGQ
jgi:hypothetical protein